MTAIFSIEESIELSVGGPLAIIDHEDEDISLEDEVSS